jgi:hypothetical protein
VETIMTEKNQHLDEGTIHAWLDGALAPDESARVEAHATTCTECALLVAEARGLIAASSRILSSLDAVPAGVVPGSDRGVDQLAVLRARRTAASRRWWRDARVVAAASLVFMAGTVSVVWRASTNQLELDQAAPATPVVADAVSPTADAPSAGATPSAPADTRARDMKSAAPERARTQERSATTTARPATVQSPRPVVVTGVGASSASNQRTEPAAKLAPPPAVAANELKLSGAVVGADRQAIDSAARASRDRSADTLARQRAALSARVGFETQRIDSIGVSAARSDRSRSLTAPTAGSAAGSRLAEVASFSGACYQLQVIPPGGQPSTRADTVRLLDEVVAERGDPLWRRARKVGASDTDPVMMWREVDSVTVELRTRIGTASNLVQFLSRPVPGSAPERDLVIRTLPNFRGQSGVQAAVAQKVACPG